MRRPRPWRGAGAGRSSVWPSCSVCSRRCLAAAGFSRCSRSTSSTSWGCRCLRPRSSGDWAVAQLWRAVLLAAAAAAVAMVTPIVRGTSLLDWMPDPIEAYFRPIPGLTGFALFPWGGFVLAGGAIGLWLDAARTPRDERRSIVALAWLGPALAAAGYAAGTAAADLPRDQLLDQLTDVLPRAPGRARRGDPDRLCLDGRRSRPFSAFKSSAIASLFVYWIHVEMVYGVLSCRFIDD